MRAGSEDEAAYDWLDARDGLTAAGGNGDEVV